MTNSVSQRVYAERIVVLVKEEAVYGQEATPDPTLDAFLVGDFEPEVQTETLTRDVFRPSFSPVPSEVGRVSMRMRFTHEIKGSGSVSTRSKLGRLLRGCRMKETLVASGAATQIETPIAVGDIVGVPVTFAKTDAPTQRFGSYLIRCSQGGASGSARLQVFRWNQSNLDPTVLPNTRHEAVTNYSSGTNLTLDASNENSLVFTVTGTPVVGDTLYAVVGGLVFRHVVTSANVAAGTPVNSVATSLAAVIDGHSLIAAVATTNTITVTFVASASGTVTTSGVTEIDLGDSGATIVPTWTGNLVKGQMWVVSLYEQGYMYRPTSDSDQAVSPSLTIHAYVDGQLFRMTAAYGTVSFTGTTGQYGRAEFEFIGQFNGVDTDPIPNNVVLELTKPPKIELAQLSIRGTQDFCAESFTITVANTVDDRLCMNAENGFAGSEVTGRSPTATFNPEGGLEVYTKMWGDFSAGEEVPLHLRVGKNAGNRVQFYMENATYTGIAISERNRVQVVEPAFQLNGLSPIGDDELRIAFT
jgi:hypothetical protein